MGIHCRSRRNTTPSYSRRDRPTGRCRVSKCKSVFSLDVFLNVAKTGDDTETLRKVEVLIQANFINGLPPHLQPNAKSLSYIPGSEQSRIFVSSYSDFSSLNARDIQNVLRERLILVHGVPFDYNYGWDLDSFGRLYDVDKKITVHGELRTPFMKPVWLK
jgi:hypothetical protein